MATSHSSGLADPVVPFTRPIKLGRSAALILAVCVASLMVAAALLVPAQAAQLESSDDSPKIDPDLAKALAAAPPGGRVAFLIYLVHDDPLDLATLPAGKLERRQAVADHLRRQAAEAQATLLVEFGRLQTAGHVSCFESLWIANAIRVTGDAEAVAAAALRPEVRRISADVAIQMLDPDQPLKEASLDDVGWGLDQVRARHAWHGLGINGAGVTIATMDTGVDWQHPALRDRYRGWLGGAAIHVGNWYDAVDNTAAPQDPNGHGTHVTGTAVGLEGLGVAPGAKWIGVRVLNHSGMGTLSDIHEGFQWLLAPAGNPDLSPDVVNASWSGPTQMTHFEPDVAALRAAGIIAVFAAGNSGPWSNSLGAPAAYHDALAIGASDDGDEVAWFSSRGPSPLTAQIKPTFVAPGAAIFSAFPGGRYATGNGTSMATPHAAGAYALLLSAEPALTQAAATTMLTTTTVPLAAGAPDMVAGWGRLDVYAAAASVRPYGEIVAQVSAAGAPLPGVAVTVTTPAGIELPFTTGSDGAIRAPLSPGSYAVRTSPFGFFEAQATGLVVQEGIATPVELALTRRPSGVLSGLVLSQGGGSGLAARMVVEGTPVTVQATPGGTYWAQLPAGQYELAAFHTGFRIGRATVIVAPGAATVRNFALEPAPAALLVDTGRWYYRSRAGYYRDALEDNDLAYDSWPIQNPVFGVPTADDLDPYDVVVWTSPEDSPALLGAGDVISTYLGAGGQLLISGQEIGTLETLLWPSYWWAIQLDGRLLGKAMAPDSVSGAIEGPFAGLDLVLNGEDSAGNQRATDRVNVGPNSFSKAAFRYPDGSAAGLVAGVCRPFRIAYLGFGLEGVTGAEDRAEVVGRALDYFAAPELASGPLARPEAIEGIALPGRQLSYTLQVLNQSATLTETFHLSLSGADWNSEIVTATLSLGPCKSGLARVTVTAPAGLPPDTSETMTLIVRAAADPSLMVEVPIQLKTPGRLLLVDDDRWYDQGPAYEAALAAAGHAHDTWRTDDPPAGYGSPPLDLLNAYQAVLWFTGYDWYQPVTAGERDALQAYLDQGGRLFLSSQDYLYYHGRTLLTREYFKLASYEESVTPTLLYGGGRDGPFSALPGTMALDYGSFQNFSDGLIPADARALLWNDRGTAAVVAAKGARWRAMFWGVPLEKIPVAAHAEALDAIVGWLGDLGDSSFAVSPTSWIPGDGAPTQLSYTATVANFSAGLQRAVALTNTLPLTLTLVPGSLGGGAAYDPAAHEISWHGILGAGEVHTISYLAQVTSVVGSGQLIKNSVRLRDLDTGDVVRREALSWAGVPDLAASSLALLQPEEHSRVVTAQLQVANHGPSSGPITATLFLPQATSWITDSIEASSGDLTLGDGYIRWDGTVDAGQTITIVAPITAAWPGRIGWLMTTAVLEPAGAPPEIREALLYLRPYQAFFPIGSRRP